MPAVKNGRQDLVWKKLSRFQHREDRAVHFALCKSRRLCYTLRARELLCRLFLGSSAVEHSTVNRMVAGSNPARGANHKRFSDRFRIHRRPGRLQRERRAALFLDSQSIEDLRDNTDRASIRRCPLSPDKGHLRRHELKRCSSTPGLRRTTVFAFGHHQRLTDGPTKSGCRTLSSSSLARHAANARTSPTRQRPRAARRRPPA